MIILIVGHIGDAAATHEVVQCRCDDALLSEYKAHTLTMCQRDVLNVQNSRAKTIQSLLGETTSLQFDNAVNENVWNHRSSGGNEIEQTHGTRTRGMLKAV
jgi:hypothetical protein